MQSVRCNREGEALRRQPGRRMFSIQSLAKHRITDRPEMRLVLGATALLFCYCAVVVSLVDKWSNHPLYSYGFAIPLISAYMIWSRGHRLRAISLSPDYTL